LFDHIGKKLWQVKIVFILWDRLFCYIRLLWRRTLVQWDLIAAEKGSVEEIFHAKAEGVRI
jgi:hypothetical protein